MSIIEIGTGAGVSGLWLLSGAPDAVLTTIDSEADHQQVARKAFIDAGIAANAGGADISCSAGLVDPGIAMNVAGLTRLVDSRIAANAGSADVTGCPRLIDPGITMDIARSPRLVDSAIPGSRDAGQRADRHENDQYPRPFRPESGQALFVHVRSRCRCHCFLHSHVCEQT